MNYFSGTHHFPIWVWKWYSRGWVVIFRKRWCSLQWAIDQSAREREHGSTKSILQSSSYDVSSAFRIVPLSRDRYTSQTWKLQISCWMTLMHEVFISQLYLSGHLELLDQLSMAQIIRTQRVLAVTNALSTSPSPTLSIVHRLEKSYRIHPSQL